MPEEKRIGARCATPNLLEIMPALAGHLLLGLWSLSPAAAHQHAHQQHAQHHRQQQHQQHARHEPNLSASLHNNPSGALLLVDMHAVPNEYLPRLLWYAYT